jgi:predicted nucleic acid-binding protein
MGTLVRQYASLPLGGTDASVVAVAERVKTLRVATLDRRHFTVVRTLRGEAFTLYPA